MHSTLKSALTIGKFVVFAGATLVLWTFARNQAGEAAREVMGLAMRFATGLDATPADAPGPGLSAEV